MSEKLVQGIQQKTLYVQNFLPVPFFFLKIGKHGGQMFRRQAKGAGKIGRRCTTAQNQRLAAVQEREQGNGREFLGEAGGKVQQEKRQIVLLFLVFLGGNGPDSAVKAGFILDVKEPDRMIAGTGRERVLGKKDCFFRVQKFAVAGKCPDFQQIQTDQFDAQETAAGVPETKITETLQIILLGLMGIRIQELNDRGIGMHVPGRSAAGLRIPVIEGKRLVKVFEKVCPAVFVYKAILSQVRPDPQFSPPENVRGRVETGALILFGGKKAGNVPPGKRNVLQQKGMERLGKCAGETQRFGKLQDGGLIQ